ncbi:TlpA family protein disulfide reductase [Paractinoplanes rishiriensis]|uniref:TlpA family protein disulfide reductase n=1 Tax=Paractinoplanes rishiriensis TaxID=1050105 RepID=UPI001EF2C877|nr:redoxin domain-containing protein [Actinoplanes rishiriensis]
MSRRLRGAALLLAAVLMAAGCSSAPPAAQEPTWQEAAAAPAAESAESDKAGADKAGVDGADPDKSVTVPETLKFSGTTLDGKKFNAATFAGKPTILWFWAPWCATCASEAWTVADLAETYQDRLGILGIAGMGNNKDMHEFVADMEVGAVPHLDDQAGKIWKKFKITQQSLYVVLDRTGKVVTTGYLDDRQLTEQVKSLVAA